MYELICKGKQWHKGSMWIPSEYKHIGCYSDQYAQYSVYQNSNGDILWTRYCDMD